MDPRAYNLGPKDREGEPLKTEDRLIGHLQEDVRWTVDIRGTDTAIMVEQPQESPESSKTCPAQSPMEESSGTVPDKQDTVTIRGFLDNSLFIHYSFIN